MSVLNFIKSDGTQSTTFQLEAAATGVKLKNLSGLSVRNAADSADVQATALTFNASGDLGITINSDAAGSGADWTYSISRPSSGMASNLALTLPPDAGTSGFVLSTNGSGVLSWVASSAGSTDTTNTTALAFGSAGTVTMFTLPANAVILAINTIVDTAFDTAATMSVGITGNLSKYVGSGDVNLQIAAGWTVNPNLPADGSSESLIITYTSASATVGAARVLVSWAIPA